MKTKSKWIEKEVGNHIFSVLNLDHPEIEAPILDEIDIGIDVYYDTRWKETDAFCDFLVSHPEWISGRSVLILGAGVGMETLITGRVCEKMYVNDYSAAALELTAMQLMENGIKNFELLPGRYEILDTPEADIVLGSFLVYNRDTLKAMLQFLNHCNYPVILMNGAMPAFGELLKKTDRKTQFLLDDEDSVCVLFK